MVARYDDYSYTAGITPAEIFDDPQDLGLRWNILKGGLQKFEFTIRASSLIDAYDRYDRHNGQLVAFYDSYLNHVLTGNIYEIVPDGRRVTYIGAGPSRRLNDESYTVGDMSDLTIPTNHTSWLLQDILDDAVVVDNGDMSNIENSGLDIEAWTPRKNSFAQPAGDSIFEIAKMGNASGAIMDFFFVDAQLDGISIAKPYPYFVSRVTNADPDWLISGRDLPANGLTLARNIWNLARYVRIAYGRIVGTATSNSADLIDSGGGFTGVVSSGDQIVNLTTGSVYTSERLVSDTQIDLNDQSGTNFSINDQYSIDLQLPQWPTQVTSSLTDLWTKEFIDFQRFFSEAQATAYQDQVLALYETPQLQQSFVLTQPMIKNGDEIDYPLWYPLFMPTGSAYFRVTDIFPDAAVFGNSDDRKATFMAVTMDYTHRNNRLRIVPSTGDSRLDVVLLQSMASYEYRRQLGEIVST
jgi:hypothetical protein